ncbi:class I SAM-dependent methyltransferase [Acholeplasma sp. OttesenSCG-928-E16]|nr:class I SAM-dependent methyltransferase [Acholeplasma sp. OttesenSCG-928-E16]
MFAHYYDLLMGDIDYKELIEFLEKNINLKEMVLDAGCGSGNILIPLVQHGYQVTGIDNDPSMLEIIKNKCSFLGISPRLIKGDILKPIEEKYDTIIMMFDVINYFRDPKELLENLYNTLKKDGKLIFDMYQFDYLKEIDNYIEDEVEPIPYIFKTNVIENELHHEIVVDGSVFEIKEYVFKLDEIIECLSTIGFKEIKVNQVFDFRKDYLIAYK